MRNILSWILFLAVLIAGAAGWILFLKQQKLTDVAQQQLNAYVQFRGQSEAFTPARFIRFEGDVLYFGLPVQVQRNNQTFVDYEEHAGTIIDSSDIYSVSGDNLNLSELPPGTELRLDMVAHPEDASRYAINAVYILD